jgi:competence protein ComEC
VKTAPAFFYGIVFFLGIALGLAFHWSYFIPLAVCLWSQRKRLVSGIAVCLLGIGWAHYSCTLPSLPEEGMEGEGRFNIESVAYSHSPFQKSILVKGTLKHFKSWSNIPCSIYFKEGQPRPLANTDLMVTGQLIPKGHQRYVLKLNTWESIPSTHSFAEARFGLKNRLRSHLQPFFPESKSRAFLLSMLTGETDDRLLALEFNRLGLLHLLGISGFQFAILAFLLGAALRLFLPYRFAYGGLIILLTAYAFSLGDSPPIERAWIGIVLYLTALLAGYRILALNALGVALLWQLIKDPLMIFHLGFQFSFLCTAAILSTYPVIKSWLTKVFPDRKFADAIRMPLLDQQGHILAFFCRETLALNLAIHLVTLPLIFYHFHKFPLLSLLYNLFLPAAVSIVYVLLIVGIGLDLFSMGGAVHAVTERLTQAILNIATHPPALYDFQWRIHDFSMTAAVIAITVMCYLSFTRLSARSKESFGDSAR